MAPTLSPCKIPYLSSVGIRAADPSRQECRTNFQLERCLRRMRPTGHPHNLSILEEFEMSDLRIRRKNDVTDKKARTVSGRSPFVSISIRTNSANCENVRRFPNP